MNTTMISILDTFLRPWADRGEVHELKKRHERRTGAFLALLSTYAALTKYGDVEILGIAERERQGKILKRNGASYDMYFCLIHYPRLKHSTVMSLTSSAVPEFPIQPFGLHIREENRAIPALCYQLLIIVAIFAPSFDLSFIFRNIPHLCDDKWHYLIFFVRISLPTLIGCICIRYNNPFFNW